MVRKADRPGHIIKAALELAAAGRWSRISLRDIAVAAGVSLAELHELYPSKSAILRAHFDTIDAAVLKDTAEFDPDDSVATFGLGKAYIQLGEYENAVPHLAHAAKIQKDFSAAYLDLGKCYEFLDRSNEAKEIYQTGIAIASRKGDLMPMREMERRLKSLAPGQASNS